MTSRRARGVSATCVALVLALAGCTAQQPEPGPVQTAPATSVRPSTATPTPSPTPTPTPTELTETMNGYVEVVSQVRTFFGHTAFGYEVMRGLNQLSMDADRGRPVYVDLAAGEPVPARPSGGFVANLRLDPNHKPLTKFKEFADSLRDFGPRVFDVAVLHLSPFDINADTDVEKVFEGYRSMIDDLQHDLPGLLFIHATAPLELDETAANTNRTRYNELVRAEYGKSGTLWDIAATESTDPDGKRVGGKKHEELYPGYASDRGDLNEEGHLLVAGELYRTVAHAWTDR